MLKVRITQAAIDYAEGRKSFFELDIPKVGDVWKAKEIRTYPNVNDGNPIVELENSNGAWMRLPADLFTLADIVERI